ncbi:MAG: pyrroline-5-carboxylate reductase [Phycisphaerales bacterium]|nr:pyrroline-5-carboxylate reductase [Phycisphaerales bacterium]
MQIGLIGGGNMAQAIIAGALRVALCPLADINVSEPDPTCREKVAALGVFAHWDNADAARRADVLVLAIKPQIVPVALASIYNAVGPDRPLMISIAAGKRLAWIEAQLPAGCRVIRVMPNTPFMVGAGMSVLARGTQATDSDMAIARRIFAAGGDVLELPESMFDAVTAVSGSGPAYFYRLVELIADGGEKCGLPRDAAMQLAVQTLIGSARLLAESNAPVDELRRRVTSPGGTTAAALASLDSDQFAAIVERAIAAATRRGAELGDQK